MVRVSFRLAFRKLATSVRRGRSIYAIRVEQVLIDAWGLLASSEVVPTCLQRLEMTATVTADGSAGSALLTRSAVKSLVMDCGRHLRASLCLLCVASVL